MSNAEVKQIVMRLNAQALKKIAEVLQDIGPSMMQNTMRNVYLGASSVRSKWVSFVTGERIPGTDRTLNNPRYAENIVMEQTGPMMFSVGIADSFEKEAKGIEDGTKERDLKKEVQKFRNKRRAKAGHYYAFIPFRHSVKEMENDQVYGDALKLKKVSVVGSFVDKDGVKRLSYNWAKGTMLFNPHTYKSKNGKDIKEKYHKLWRFDTTTGASKGSSTYLTFRCLSAKSPEGSWIIPAKKGLGVNLRDLVQRTMEPSVMALMQEGLDKDFKRFADTETQKHGK